VLSRRAATRVLFAAAVLALPLPYYIGEVESAPLVRLAFISGLFGSVLVAEGAGGTNGLFFALGLVQLVVWAGVLRLGAGLLSRSLARLPWPRARTVLVALLALALIGAGLSPLYDTPLSSSRGRSNLLGLFE
jgi:hypothetical protein